MLFFIPTIQVHLDTRYKMRNPDSFFLAVYHFNMYKKLIKETTQQLDVVPWFDAHTYTVVSNNLVNYNKKLQRVQYVLWMQWQFFMCTCDRHVVDDECKKTR